MLLRKRAVGSFLLCILLLFVPALLLFGVQVTLNPVLWLVDRTMALNRPMQASNPPTTHVVLFKFKESVTPFQIKDVRETWPWSLIFTKTDIDYVENALLGKGVHSPEYKKPVHQVHYRWKGQLD
jgi:hypothetical protein